MGFSPKSPLSVFLLRPFNQSFRELLEDAVLANQILKPFLVCQQCVYQFGW